VKKIPPRNSLLDWKKWLEEELTPPYSDAVRCNPQLKWVLEAFLKLATLANQSSS
jgi:hypothetical protein